MRTIRSLSTLGALLALGGCESIVAEPPPPPSRLEVVAAAPGALGARAAGTDAAPKPPGFPLAPGEERDEEEDGEPSPPDAGASPTPGKAVPL